MTPINKSKLFKITVPVLNHVYYTLFVQRETLNIFVLLPVPKFQVWSVNFTHLTLPLTLYAIFKISFEVSFFNLFYNTITHLLRYNAFKNCCQLVFKLIDLACKFYCPALMNLNRNLEFNL